MNTKNIINLVFLASLLLMLISCKAELETSPKQTTEESLLENGTKVHTLVINENPTYIHEIDGEYFFSDDVIISKEQFDYLKRLANSPASSERSTIPKDFMRTWVNGIIPYVLPARSQVLNDRAYQLFLTNIDSAFKVISSRTNIEFIERSNQPSYIAFRYSSTSNSSPLGRQNNGNTINVVNIDYPYIIAHEIMHSMGIHHEQCRPDRNLYMNVNLENAQAGTLLNFNIDPTMSGFGDFDFGSVMMYQSTDFAINPANPVLSRLDGSIFTKQRIRLSEGDYAGINHLYGQTNTEDGIQGLYRIQTFLPNDSNIVRSSDRIVLSGSNPNINHQFIIRKSSEHGYFIIRSASNSTHALSVSNDVTTDPSVNFTRNNHGDNQKWKILNEGNEGISLAPKNALTRRLEVRRNAPNNLSKLIVENSRANVTTGDLPLEQRFKLMRVD